MGLIMLSSLTTVQAAGDGGRINSVEHRFRLVYWQDGIDIDETLKNYSVQVDLIGHGMEMEENTRTGRLTFSFLMQAGKGMMSDVCPVLMHG